MRHRQDSQVRREFHRRQTIGLALMRCRQQDHNAATAFFASLMSSLHGMHAMFWISRDRAEKVR